MSNTMQGDILNNKYEVVEILEKEETGSIYLAKDVKTEDHFVLKEINESLDSALYNTVLAEFSTTVKNLETIERRSNAPKMVDFFVDRDTGFLVIEYKKKTLNRLKAYPSLGKTLEDRYMVIKGIASGGFGVVYLVKDATLKEKYWALKEMHEHGGDPELAERSFRDEANLLAKLEHPNIPGITHFFTINGRHYLVMEYIKGETLKDKLKKLAPEEYFSEEQILAWAMKLCEVLDYLHNLPSPVVFRDLKPDNVMVNDRGELKLIDFGIARVFEGPRGQNTTRALLTEGYAPPEQWMGKAEERSDIYSLGATLHHLITKIHPREQAPNFKPPKEINKAISDKLSDIIIRCLNMSVNKRYSNMKEVLKELEQIKGKTRITEIIKKADEYKEKKDYLEAGYEYKKILEIEPANENALFSIASCYKELNLINDSRKYFEKFLEISKNEELREKAEEILDNFDRTLPVKNKAVSPGIIDPGKSTVSIISDTIIEADGVSSANINITLIDTLGNPVPNMVIDLSTGRKEDIIEKIPLTDKDGETFCEISSSLPGIVTVTVRVSGIEIKEKPEIKFVPSSTQFYNGEEKKEDLSKKEENIKTEHKTSRHIPISLLLGILIIVIGIIGGFYILNINKKNQIDKTMKLANDYASQKNYEAAIVQYDKVLQLNPDVLEARKGLADMYTLKKDFDKALTEYQTLIILNPEDTYVLSQMGKIYKEKADNDRAIDAFDKILKLKPDDSKIWSNLSEIYLLKKDYDKVLDISKKLLKTPEFNPGNVISLGNIFLSRKEYDKSKECFYIVLSVDKKNVDAYRGIIELYTKKRDLKKVISENEKLLTILPGDIKAHISTGMSYKELKDYIKANEWFQKALKLKPAKEDKEYITKMSFECYIKIGEGNLAQKKYKDGESNFIAADKLIKGKDEAKKGLAKCYMGRIDGLMKNQDYAKAEELCNKVLALFPKGEFADKANKYLSKMYETTPPSPEYNPPVYENPPYNPPVNNNGPDVM